MPARSAVSLLLAAPAPPRLRWLCASSPFPYPSPATPTLRRPALLSRTSAPLPGHGLHKTAIAEGRRAFHGTPVRRDDAIDNARNHYETLKIAPTASAPEIKKSFYKLSKTHHPDLHETAGRRAAARRFMRISEAYSVLSSPAKRAKYDREHMELATASASAHTPSHAGSYASTGPAGGRPASGLSRRRGTFCGPPPSFFRSGGWGAQAEKRRAAHEESTGGAGAGAGAEGAGAGTGGARPGGMGLGQDPFGHADDVPHFDKEGHQRTGRHSDRRREARRAAAASEGFAGGGQGPQRVAVEPERGVASMFFAIGGVLLLSIMAPFVISRVWLGSPQRPSEKAGNKGKA
ncbi:DnaJ-domain-containing protein [Xylaria palmicola]|nr:DnaJ-domain-containing protein [Xylaria palmicola]